jgi:hypothetical protein
MIRRTLMMMGAIEGTPTITKPRGGAWSTHHPPTNKSSHPAQRLITTVTMATLTMATVTMATPTVAARRGGDIATVANGFRENVFD